MAPGKIYVWSKYHIENFLIDEEAIFMVFKKIRPKDNPFLDPQNCLDGLTQIVSENKTLFVNSMIKYECNSSLREEYMKISANDEEKSILQKAQALKHIIETNLESTQVSKIIQNKDIFNKSIIDNTWKDILPGRSVLQLLLNKFGRSSIKYEAFKNLIVDEMKNKIPSEVKSVIDEIAFSKK